MNLSVKDAATVLGCSPRTLRAMLLDGRITGYKSGGRWVVPRRNLPLTDAQRREAEGAIEDLHAAVDEAVPAHIRRQLGGGVAELRAFARGRAALLELTTLGLAPAAADALREGLCALAEGHHQELAHKIRSSTVPGRTPRSRNEAAEGRALDPTGRGPVARRAAPSIPEGISSAERRRDRRSGRCWAKRRSLWESSQYDAAVKIEALTRARGCASRAAAELLLTPASDDPGLSRGAAADALTRLAATIEADVLPPIGGLLRRAESLPARRAS